MGYRCLEDGIVPRYPLSRVASQSGFHVPGRRGWMLLLPSNSSARNVLASTTPIWTNGFNRRFDKASAICQPALHVQAGLGSPSIKYIVGLKPSLRDAPQRVITTMRKFTPVPKYYPKQLDVACELMDHGRHHAPWRYIIGAIEGTTRHVPTTES